MLIKLSLLSCVLEMALPLLQAALLTVWQMLNGWPPNPTLLEFMPLHKLFPMNMGGTCDLPLTNRTIL